MKKNTAIAMAMVLVAVLAALAIIIVTIKTPEDIQSRMIGDVTSNISYSEEDRTYTEHVEIPVNLEGETSVLLIDESGSMDDVVSANSSYDAMVPFSDYIYQKGGNSHIARCIMNALDMGIRELGVVSDLESYPEEDIHNLDFKFYTNREVYIFCSGDVDTHFLPIYKQKLQEALDPSTCTLVFCYADGSREVIYDQYVNPESIIAEADIEVEPETILPNVEIVDNRELETGNYIAPHVVRNIIIAGIAIIAFLIEVILALLLRRGEKEPDWVKKAVATGNIALDGSGSVKGVYIDMLRYLKAHKKQIKTIWRFADDVRQLTLAEAKDATPGGQTHGWEALRTMMESGIQEVTIMSDMQFNDTPVSGLHFDRIVFIVPSNYDTDVLEDLKTLASVYEVIQL